MNHFGENQLCLRGNNPSNYESLTTSQLQIYDETQNRLKYQCVEVNIGKS